MILLSIKRCLTWNWNNVTKQHISINESA
jgi:hypothetical protein